MVGYITGFYVKWKLIVVPNCYRIPQHTEEEYHYEKSNDR